MEVVHIDLPIFSSPTDAFGYFGGCIEVSHLPKVGEPFPWPEHWLTGHETLFREQCMQVWSVTPLEGQSAKFHVTMYGIVCGGCEGARALSAHIERSSGVLFDEWEHDGPLVDPSAR